jgi:hypothetical protein
MSARAIILNLAANLTGKGLQQAQKELANVGKSVNSLADKVKGAAAAFVGLQAAQVGGRFLTGSIEQARDLERNMAGLNTVFKEVAPQFDNFLKQSEEIGLSQSQAAKASVFLGSVLKQSGFTMQEQSDITQRLVKLGADLAITYGYDVQEALLGMTALFRGEYDPIEKFGVAMKQNEINVIAAARGFKNLTPEMERLVHQQIRLELLFERGADAMGAFERQAGTLAVEQLKLQATFNNMRQELGTEFIPVFAELVEALRPIIRELTPNIIAAFSSISEVVLALGDNTEELKAFVSDLIDFYGVLISIGAKVTAFFVANHEIVVTLAGSVLALTAAFKIYTTAAAIATATTAIFNVTLSAGKIGLILTGISALAALFAVLAAEAGKANRELEKQAQLAGRTTDEQKQYNEALEQLARIQDNQSKGARSSEYSFKVVREAAHLLNKELAVSENISFERLRGELNGLAAAAQRAAISQQQLTYQYINFRRIERGLGPIDIVSGLLLPPVEDFQEASGKARNYVKEFFDNIADEVAKQVARVKLRGMGASEGLVEAIVGAPGDWEAVYKKIIAGGKAALDQLQELFNTTAAGLQEIEEAQKKAQEEQAKYERQIAELTKEFDDFADATRSARDSVLELVNAFDVLPTAQRQLGEFERAAVGMLENVERSLKDAFESGTIYEESYNELLRYSRAELAVLQQIQRQRDELKQRRDLAAALINDTQAAVRSSANIANLLDQSARATERVDMVRVIQDTVKAGRNLKEFRTTVISAFVEPVEEIKSRSRQLLDSYKTVVDTTRNFVDNMKRLRALGLNEQLFAQLVEAGADAGGATAAALVEGGADAVRELNGMFRELDSLGAELGEQTAQVMYGEGEEFVNGIIDGLNSRLDALESTARSLAETFVATFGAILTAGVEAVIADAARRLAEALAALPKPSAPALPQPSQPFTPPPVTPPAVTQPRPSTGTSTGGGGAALPNTGSQRAEDLRFDKLKPNLSAVNQGSQRAEDLRFAKAVQPTTVINVNVKTDPTKSAAQTGTAVAKAVNKAVGTGGALKIGFGAI